LLLSESLGRIRFLKQECKIKKLSIKGSSCNGVLQSEKGHDRIHLQNPSELTDVWLEQIAPAIIAASRHHAD
jgi:hypothetical protein